jgi:hypothetical protein
MMATEQKIKGGHESRHNPSSRGELNSSLKVQIICQFKPSVKLLALLVIPAFCPRGVVTFRGQCRNVGADVRSNRPHFAGMQPVAGWSFGKLNALTRLR